MRVARKPRLLKAGTELLFLNLLNSSFFFFFFFFLFFFCPSAVSQKHLHVESLRLCPIIEMLGGNLLPSSAWKCSTPSPLIKQKMVCHV